MTREDKTKKIIVSEKQNFRYLEKEDDIWFVARDILNILDISNTTETLKSIHSINIKKELILVKNGFQRQNMKIINTDGLKQILQSTRSKKVDVLINSLSAFQISFDTIFVCKEASFLRIISESFISLNQKKEYTVKNYRIDLYFIDYKLAIECDENTGHKNSIYEKNRQEFLEKELYCSFIRFNPDEKNFNIGFVIHKIIKHIYC
jgi:very-short-patch-repair endonuclease